MAISNSFLEITKLGAINDSDLNLHHELSGGYSELFSKSVQKVATFINKKGNPFKKKSSVSLFNFCTGQTVLPEVSKKLLDYFIHGNEKFKKFRQEQFIEKSKLLSETIKKINLPKFTEASCTQKQVSNESVVKSTKKDIGQSQRKIDIAKAKGYDAKEILTYVHLTENMLFDGQSTSKPDKAMAALVTELEKTLNKEEHSFKKESPLKSVTIADFISQVRKVPLVDKNTFRDALDSSFEQTRFACKSHQIDVICDSYLESSIKHVNE